jgi:hypothetical protein
MNEQQLIEAVRTHAMRNYDHGWDTLVECYADGDILEIISGTNTAGEAIAAVAARLRVPVAVAGYVVKVMDVDGLAVRSFEDYEVAAGYFYEMAGMGAPLIDLAVLDAGRSVSAVSAYGTSVSIAKA